MATSRPRGPRDRRRATQLTTGQGTWSARCGESRTPGAVGGSRETDGGNTETAPAVLPNLRHENAVLHRHAGGVRYQPAARAWFAALARLHTAWALERSIPSYASDAPGLAPQAGGEDVRHRPQAQARPPNIPEHRPPCRSAGEGDGDLLSAEGESNSGDHEPADVPSVRAACSARFDAWRIEVGGVVRGTAALLVLARMGVPSRYVRIPLPSGFVEQG